MKLKFKRTVEREYGIERKEFWELKTRDFQFPENTVTAEVSTRCKSEYSGRANVPIEDLPEEVADGFVGKLRERREELAEAEQAIRNAECE